MNLEGKKNSGMDYGMGRSPGKSIKKRKHWRRKEVKLLNTLRRRLILSHILPVAIIVPILGIALFCLAENSANQLPEEINTLLVQLRLPIMILMAFGLILGAFIGWTLAIEMERPLHTLKRTVNHLKDGAELKSSPLSGPEEIQALSSAIQEMASHRHQLEQDRRQLLANLVHELGRPVGAIYSATEAFEHGAYEDPEARLELLAGMKNELHGLQRLLEDLASLRDQIVGEMELQPEETNLNQWLSQTLPLWQRLAEQKGLVWETCIAADLLRLKIDRERMNQVLGNILNNAIQYTPPGGKILVISGVHRDEFWIRVSDTGNGIPPEDLENIFKPFHRGSQPNAISKGMGLGLSIAQDLVQAHHGRLEVRSTPGKGSDFTIWLPKSNPVEDPLATVNGFTPDEAFTGKKLRLEEKTF
jgi:two-component system sensor histidine kinase BaeS